MRGRKIPYAIVRKDRSNVQDASFWGLPSVDLSHSPRGHTFVPNGQTTIAR